MLKPVPSLALILDVDERLAQDETRLEVKRCWAHVGSTVLRAHEPSEGEPVNRAEFMVKFGTQKYLRSSDEGADEMWETVIERWLYNMFGKVGNNMKIFNRRQREEGNPELYFDTLDVNLEDDNAIVTVKLDSNSDIAPETAYMLTRVREALNAGLLGEGPYAVGIPSAASYAEQAEAAAIAAAQKAEEEARAAEEQRLAEEAAAEAAAQEAEENFAPAPDLVAPDPDELDEERIRAELEARYTLPDADFAIDYTRWDVTLPDGAVRELDSATMQFID